MTVKDFGEIDKSRVRLYCIRNSRGSEVKITSYGSMLTSWITQDSQGDYTDVLNGFDNLQQCIHRYECTHNNYDIKKARWDVEIAEDHSLLLHYEWDSYYNHQPVKTKVIRHYKYTDEDELIIEDRASVNNPFIPGWGDDFCFKLGDAISDHEIMINADRYYYASLVDHRNKTTEGTPFDLRAGRLIRDIAGEINLMNGMDYALNSNNGFSIPSVTLTSYDSGRRLEIYTNQSSLRFSADNYSVCLKPLCTDKIFEPQQVFHTITKYKIVRL